VNLQPLLGPFFLEGFVNSLQDLSDGDSFVY